MAELALHATSTPSCLLLTAVPATMAAAPLCSQGLHGALQIDLYIPENIILGMNQNACCSLSCFILYCAPNSTPLIDRQSYIV